MAIYRVWYSTESFADYIIDHTGLKKEDVVKRKIYESDANNATNFHKLPDHIKKILYLDAPDLIVEYDFEPIFSIEITTEAGTGHNAFQRFARIAAAVENNVPAIYIYPEAAIISRSKGESRGTTKWDTINPLIFLALKRVRGIYGIPALLYYYPSYYRECPNALNCPQINNKGLKYDSNIIKYTACPDSKDSEMISLFHMLDLIIQETKANGIIKGREKLLSRRDVIERTDWMDSEFFNKKTSYEQQMSPITATITIETTYLLNHLKKYSRDEPELLASRSKTIIYQVNADFRGDPYPGALSALDYLLCREGKSFEERKYNLVLCWGTVSLKDDIKNFEIKNDNYPRVKRIASVKDFVDEVQKCSTKSMLTMDYSEIKKRNSIPRYYMQVRYGSMFSKNKHIRVYSYFADAILFKDGALWREG